MESVSDFLKDKVVESWNLLNRDIIEIRFKNTPDKCLKLYARTEPYCYTCGWFERLYSCSFFQTPYGSLDPIVDKTIKDIKIDYNKHIELGSYDPDSPYIRKNYLITMRFVENNISPLQFVLCNSSNGSYSTWLDMEIEPC